MKKQPPPLLPPLSFDALQQVNDIEDYARIALMTCSNREQVRRVVGTTVISIFDIQVNCFAFLPDWQQEWMREIRHRSIDSVIEMCPFFAPGEEFRPELNRILQEHIERMLARVQAERAKRAAIRGESQPAATERPATKPISPRELMNSYLSKFPDEKIKILDICWAAGQHYREWKRWIKNQCKDDSTADVAFRRILSSGKRPLEFNKKHRPPKWQ
ncbi:MAG TPA: hypothetical protein VI685_28195 [Candidatus Angelobacter sp.]